MTKTLKKLLCVVFGAFAFLFAGFFFAGCGVDYDSIFISSDVQSIELEVGQSTEVVFSISNYQKGFDNKVNISEKTTAGQGTGATSVFTCSDVTYISDSKMKVTITAVAGGEAILYARTLEAGKECSVDVKVVQHSETMNVTDDVVYVTDKDPLVPSPALFEFDSHTTDKTLSYFFLNRRGAFAERNIDDYVLESINRETKIAHFETENEGAGDADIVAFDSVSLDVERDKIIFAKDGEETEIDFVSTFELLAVYDYSEAHYDKILYTVSDVYVLPSLDLKVYGGYLIGGAVAFSEIESGHEIVVVPNNTKMHEYIIKLEISNAIEQSPVSIKNGWDNDVYLDIVSYDYTESGISDNTKVEYWKVSQKSYAQGQTKFDFSVYYDIAQEIQDDNVNTHVEFVGKIEVAPTNLTINNTSEPPTLRLYNSYYISDFGWNNLYVGVGATYGISPSYDGVYFTYDASKVELTYGGVKVVNGNSRLYKDLSKPFRIKGAQGATQGETKVTVHLVSDILQEGSELTLEQNCIIAEGANVLTWTNAYQNYRYFYLDVDAGRQSFFDVLYADRQFQSVSVEFTGGSNVVTLEPDEEPYIKVDEYYYLNMFVTPRAVGIGYYRIYLDNGRNQDIAFQVVRTLQPETTSIRLADEGNGSVTYYAYERSVDEHGEEAEFDDILNIEIINPSNKDVTTFGSYANLNIYANLKTNGITAVADNNTIDIVGAKTNFKLVTTKNGQAQVVFTLTGLQINMSDDDKPIFSVSDKTLTITVNVISYSLVSEFYVKNSGSFANVNYVYYGEGAGVEEKTIDFEMVINSSDSSYFYRYGLTREAIVTIFDEADDISVEGSSFEIFESDCEQTLVNEVFDRKFVYFYVQTRSGSPIEAFTNVTITRENEEHEVEEKTFTLNFSNGLMFQGSTYSFDIKDDDDNVVASYTIEFSNFYKIGARDGSFNVLTFTYAVSEDNVTENNIVKINAIISQRGFSQKYNKNYSMTIMPKEFKAIDSISLASGLAKLNFTSAKLSYTLGVYTFPVASTNKEICVEFIRGEGNKYADLINYTVEASSSDSGVYMVTISCENFYNKHKNAATTEEMIENIACALTGTIYIYPREWGNSYSSLNKKTPLSIAVQYRNGSKANPYLIENANDILTIGSNEAMLRSHYEINSVIDMSGIKNAKPIGILGGQIVGFSGTIIGSSSQAGITNVNVVYDAENSTRNNFAELVNGVLYAGLFAKTNGQIDDSSFVGSTIENLSVAGSFDIASEDETAAGLLAAEHYGMLVNVGAGVSTSNVKISDDELNIGALVGRNYGYIYQDFKKYNNEGQADGESGTYVSGYRFRDVSEYTIQTDDNGNKYVFVDDEIIYVDDSGYEIGPSGKRVVYEESSTDGYEVALPEMWNYAGQKSKNLAFFDGRLRIDATGADVNAGGVVGKNFGEIEKYGTSSAYGYGSYSAYTLIDVVGDDNVVALGGVVGRIFGGNKNIKVSNLLVGGEVDARELTDSQDYVGGILGFTEEGNENCAIAIENNTSRTFVRGIKNVGGIAGYENWAETDDNYLVRWGLDNKIEAIDDGRSAFESSLIIKYSYYNIPADLIKSVCYAIGNKKDDNRREYESYTSTIRFNNYSYLSRNLITTPKIDRNNTSTTGYYGDYISFDADYTHTTYLDYYHAQFTHRDVNIGVSGGNRLVSEEAPSQVVFFMYYFGVDGMLSGEQGQGSLQESVNNLNIVSPNDTQFYPFRSSSTDVLISVAKSSILSVDTSGFMTVRGVGLVVLNLDSILNINISQKIYIYVVGYFDKDAENSLYYVGPTSNSVRMTDGSSLIVYGKANTNLYVVPSYKLDEHTTIDNERFEISQQGVLNYQNVRYLLSKNSFITTDVDEDDSNSISSVQVNKQTVVFRRVAGAVEGVNDRYDLAPILKADININGQTIVFAYNFKDATKISLSVSYKNTATLIKPHYNYHSIQTNNDFSDFVMIESTNSNEHLFYQIYKLDGEEMTLVQDKTPLTMASVDDYGVYINNVGDGLFDIQIKKRDGEINVFDYTFKINKESPAFKNRFETNIYGEYAVMLYANELVDGVSGQFVVKLEEATVNYVSLVNYSSISDVSKADEVVVPSQNGLLEISVDPIEAVFDSISISNSATNYREGAGEIRFTFVYLKNGEFIPSYTFETNVDGTMSFTYRAMKEFLDDVGVDYNGKIYIRYFLPANNVEDGVDVGFDVKVTYATTEMHETSIPLITKLASYAKLSFANRESSDQVRVARGLDYSMVLDYYGFTEENITITSSKEDLAHVEKSNGRYVLHISSARPNDEDRAITITTHAEKIIDDNIISSNSTLEIYLMEYVFDYEFVEGKFEDIVKGMKNGVINDAIGNPYTLEMDIAKFVEYDASNSEVENEVNSFVADLTSGVEWNVYLNDEVTTLESGKVIKTQYYVISSYTFTPLQIYNAESNVYYFSAEVRYAAQGGIYVRDDASLIKLYTEFSFEVHDQSTEDSPIPVNSYEELINMQDNEWYILTKDIVIPDVETAQAQGLDPFEPITANISGFDGNGRLIALSGRYVFDDANVGIFSNVSDGMVLKNVEISIASDVVFSMTSLAYNVGILAATNSGVITNCSVNSANGSVFSAVFGGNSDDAQKRDKSGSYVAGITASNSGFITHSRVSANMKADVNLAGVVAQNSRHIASSYFMGATLENSASFEFTAGFVIANSGVIYTSYVSGNPGESLSSMYYDGTANAIKSSGNISGFVYENTGSVFDSYSNISLKSESGAYSTGFVYTNTGTVERCFSTSQLTSNATSSYGFVRFTSSNGMVGTLANCFFLQDETYGVNISIEEVKGLAESELKPLAVDEFDDFEQNFEKYVYRDEGSIDSIWVIRSFGEQKRLELVAANIIAESVRDLDHVEQIRDEETGSTYAKYIYVYRNGTNALGSLYNPIVIYDYKTMEDYILAENNAAGYNYAYYRIVCDIDYSEMRGHSALYKTRFMGYLEANFVNISGITLLSNESLVFAGLFAEIGSSVDERAIGTMMNFTFKPDVVSFVGAQVVGAVAGKIDNAEILNVNVLSDNGQMVVLGNNIVGGAIGLAMGEYEITNVYSTLGAKAFNLPGVALNNFDQTVREYSTYSFAGALVGVASGEGKVKNALLDDDDKISVFGNRAGLLFGLIDEDVSVENISVSVNADMLISASGYGGFVAGESRGEIKNVEILSYISTFENFKKIPNTPSAVGGVTGFMYGGKISDVVMKQSISIAKESDNVGIESLGGIVGKTLGDVDIENVEVTADFVAFKNVGGIIGIVSESETTGSNIITINDIKVISNLTAGGRSLGNLGIGGVVGCLHKGNTLNLRTNINAKNTIDIGNITAKIYAYNESAYVNAGGVVGTSASTEVQYVYNTESYVRSGDIKAYEMSQPNTPTLKAIDATMHGKDEEHGGLTPSEQKVVSFVTMSATNCTTSFTANFTYPVFNTSGSVDASSYGITVYLFGQVVANS